jgi:hypothetical protein
VDVKSILLEARGVEGRRREGVAKRPRDRAMQSSRVVVAIAIIVALLVLFGPAVVLILQNLS